LIWPPVLKIMQKYSVFFAVFIIIGTFFAQNIHAVNTFSIHGIKIFQAADKYFRVFCFQYIALGALAAWIAVQKPHWCKFIFRPEVQAMTYLVLIKHLVYYSDYGKWDALGRGIPNVLLIMNVALNPNTWFSFENRFLKYLGEISYGVYVYHIICIHLMVLLLLRIGKFGSPHWNTIFLYLTAIPFTIICAALSNHYFEKRFLDMRKMFKAGKKEPIDTGDLVTNPST
jgi:peptidoglycan/LPS O-acetylase OafA/YrhL